ncbi:MAG TPA: amidohydrolase family protein [Candidatus Tectomicrobia bacterium]|nr:amidohydrolase family protein [Candidatus Tectomicrobia bacterium]
MVSEPTNADWLALTPEEPLEADLPICDPHHHLWDFRAARVAPRYLLDEILADVQSGHNVVSTVFIECASMFKVDGPEAMRPVGETEFVNGIAAMSASGLYGKPRIAAGIVGTADLQLGDAVAAVLDAHLVAGGGRFRGIRLGATWDASDEVPNHRTNPPKGLLLRQDFRAGFAHLAPRQLTFEAWCYHHQIPEVTDLARAFPGTTIILDHFGGPIGIGPYAGKAAEVFAQWRAHMAELATCPNVVAKLGGINMEVNGFGWHEKSRPPSSQELVDATRHYYEYTLEHFGVERCMFESNFPVDKASCSYTVLWNAFKRLTAGYSTDEKAKLFHDTAARIYRLGRWAPAQTAA